MAEFFGFEIKRKGQEKELPKVSFVPNTDEDGAGVISTGGHFGAYLDLDGDKAKSEIDLIMKYRDVAAQPECDAAVEDIVNEAIVGDHDDVPIDIVFFVLLLSKLYRDFDEELVFSCFASRCLTAVAVPDCRGA